MFIRQAQRAWPFYSVLKQKGENVTDKLNRLALLCPMKPTRGWNLAARDSRIGEWD